MPTPRESPVGGTPLAVGLVVAVAWVAVLSVAAPAVPAGATIEDVHLEVTPNTVQAGGSVHVRARCGDNTRPATVTSRAFPDVKLEPRPGSPVMVAEVTVPADTRPDDYRVRLSCAGGASASVDLFVLDMTRPTRAPATGGGGTAGRAG